MSQDKSSHVDRNEKPWRDELRDADRKYARGNTIVEIKQEGTDEVIVTIRDEDNSLVARYKIQMVVASYPPHGCSTSELKVIEELFK